MPITISSYIPIIKVGSEIPVPENRNTRKHLIAALNEIYVAGIDRHRIYKMILTHQAAGAAAS